MKHKSEVEDDGYDAAYMYEEPKADDGKSKKQIDLQVVENPYYEKEWTETENDDKPSNQDEENIDVTNAEIVKTTQNAYYEM